MDSTSYDFLHRITNLIFKSKAGMAYDKSIINIDINFDNEDQAIPKLPKPILPRKDRKDKIATIQPSEVIPWPLIKLIHSSKYHESNFHYSSRIPAYVRWLFSYVAKMNG